MEQYHTSNPGAPASFCRTPTAVAIHEVITLACAYSAFGMGAVIGAPGVGKTMALKAYAADQPGVRYCAMNSAQSSVARALSRVHGAIDTGARASADPYGRILEAVRDHAPSALLCDEAHHLGDDVLNALRSLHDETGLPIVFSGNESLYGRVTEKSAEAFKQLASRVGATVVIEATSEGDVRVLAEHYGFTDEELDFIINYDIKYRMGGII